MLSLKKGQQITIFFLQKTFLTKIIFNLVLSTIQDIENSITFCKLNTLHPSIIKSQDLFLEIQKIASHYKNTSPFEVNYNFFKNFQFIIKINCKIDKNQIIYFLHLPVDYDKDFELFYMLPIPTRHESEFFTIIPNTKMILKAKNGDLIKPLFNKCTPGKIYHCEDQMRTNFRASCEENILLHQNWCHCSFTNLKIAENHVEAILEINQYLAVFPKQKKLEIHCENVVETKTLIGIFLVKRDSCKILFKQQELIFQEASYGKPLRNLHDFQNGNLRFPSRKT